MVKVPTTLNKRFPAQSSLKNITLVEEGITALHCLLEWLESQSARGKDQRNPSQYVNFIFIGLANNVWRKKTSYQVRLSLAGY